jgi:hypothetical protein
MAETSTRPSPLLGVGDAGEGIKYQDGNGEVRFFTSKNLRDRMGRDTANPKKRHKK